MKKIFRFVATLLSVVALFNLTAMPINAETESFSYILIEADTLAIIEGENYDAQVNCGYLSKLMSILLIAESIETGKFQLDSELSASASVDGTKGSVIWLQQGDRLTVDELLKAVIVGNANDALTVLAEKSHQSIKNFTSEMNRLAFDLGLRNTAFSNPYGYYADGDYSSAYDLAVISAELSKYEFLTPYFQIWHDFIKNGETELVNENSLARTFDGHIGFKATHSENSGYCISEGVTKDGVTYITVILGASDEDVMFSTAKTLINKGFKEYKVTVPGFLDELLLPIKVKNGEEGAVELMLEAQNSVVVPKAVSELTNKIVIPEYIEAPVKKGQKIGTVAFYSKDTLVYETNIITKSDVPKTTFMFVLKKTLLNLLKL